MAGRTLLERLAQGGAAGEWDIVTSGEDSRPPYDPAGLVAPVAGGRAVMPA
jgi:hypothetical protein